MTTKNQKIVKVAEINYEITECDYNLALIRAGLKEGNETEILNHKHNLTKEMYDLVEELEA